MAPSVDNLSRLMLQKEVHSIFDLFVACISVIAAVSLITIDVAAVFLDA